MDPLLIDRFGRTFQYARIALTEHCNLRCVYCMPEEGVPHQAPERFLDIGEVLRLLGVLAKLGVTKVRYTGGEPLLRKDLVTLVDGARRVPGIEGVHLTTNGVLLDRYLGPLVEAGLRSLNISLDTLRGERFERVTRRASLERVRANLALALTGPLHVKLNCVVMRGINDDELGDFAALTRDHPLTVRFIELMPFDAQQVWKRGRFLSAERIVEALGAQVRGLEAEAVAGSATEEHLFRVAGHRGRLAVIPAYTRSLCRTCDRIRITADGQLRNCLFSETEYDLRGLLREGADDAAIAERIRLAMSHKLIDGWAAQRGGAERARTSMTQIGG